MANVCSCCCGRRKDHNQNVAVRTLRYTQRQEMDSNAGPSTFTSVPVYYVKGSRVPVECLRPGIDRDSRFFRDQKRKARVAAQRRTAVNADIYLGNPSLLLLLNWQTIPPLSRLSLLRRTLLQSGRNFSSLPTIREEVSLEAGDSQLRGMENAASSATHTHERQGMRLGARRRQLRERPKRQKQI